MTAVESSMQMRDQLVALLPRLRRFARNLTRNPHDADDVVQTALERALSRSSQWHSDSRLDSWMFKIIRNAWIDTVRSRVRQDRLFAPAEAGAAVGDLVMERESDLLSVQAAIAALSEEQRDVVSLVLIEGLPYRDAAEVLDVPIGTLTSRLARAREALQHMLGGSAEEAT